MNGTVVLKKGKEKFQCQARFVLYYVGIMTVRGGGDFSQRSLTDNLVLLCKALVPGVLSTSATTSTRSQIGRRLMRSHSNATLWKPTAH